MVMKGLHNYQDAQIFTFYNRIALPCYSSR